jgi:hypothetical protein
MLIAMMGNTYHQIIKKSEKEWRKQWAQVVILLERSFSPQDLKKFQNQYCIKLPSKDQDNKPELGLMVIKKVSKTKAFQKTNCIRNWKKFSKAVLALLKSNSLTAKQLLEIWEFKEMNKYSTKMKKSKNDNLDSSWNGVNMNTLKRYSIAVPNSNQQNGGKNNNNKSNNKQNSNKNNSNKNNSSNQLVAINQKQKAAPAPPLPEPVKLKIDQTSRNAQKSNFPAPITANTTATNNSNNKDNNKDNSFKITMKSESDVATPTSVVSRTNSENGDYETTTPFSRINTNKVSYKKAFYPNQTTKIYPFMQLNESSIDNYELVTPKQVNIISPLENSRAGQSGSATSTSSSTNNVPVVTSNRNVASNKTGLFSNNLNNTNYNSDIKSDTSSLDGDLYGTLFRNRKSPDDDKL